LWLNVAVAYSDVVDVAERTEELQKEELKVRSRCHPSNLVHVDPDVGDWDDLALFRVVPSN
jgi:hypothetical protein